MKVRPLHLGQDCFVRDWDIRLNHVAVVAGTAFKDARRDTKVISDLSVADTIRHHTVHPETALTWNTDPRQADHAGFQVLRWCFHRHDELQRVFMGELRDQKVPIRRGPLD